jgi:predicted metal-dependent enzyme (double-stranded beta helix superfamily)
MADTPRIARLRDFIVAFDEAIERIGDEPSLIKEGKNLLTALVAHDDWLPAAFAVPDPQRYQQYLLHCDSRQRFSVVSFVWGPGQSTPIHDHRTWGLIGMLRGSEVNQHYELDDAGVPQPAGPSVRLDAGQVEALSPTTGDIHRVRNFYADRPSISIHVYGRNIGAVTRSTYDEDGKSKVFISGYSSSTVPNLWDLSKENSQ